MGSRGGSGDLDTMAGAQRSLLTGERACTHQLVSVLPSSPPSPPLLRADTAPAAEGDVPAGGSRYPYVTGLDPLRGLAALAVAFFHFTNNGWLPHGHWLKDLGYYGHLGVRTFFVISGFVVPFAMACGGYSLGSFFPFLGRRMVRIYPPYLASLLSMGLSVWMRGATPPGVGDSLAHFFYLNDLLGRPWLLDVYWTLALEMQFYLFAALAWPLLSRPQCLPFLGLVAVCVGVGSVTPGDRHLLGYISYFLLGGALFRLHTRLDTPLLATLLIAALAGLIWRQHGLASSVAALLPVPAVLVFASRHGFSRFLGKISYSLYLCHLSAGGFLLAAVGPWVTNPGLRSGMVAAALALSVAVAWVGYRVIEAPSIAWSKRVRYRS